MKKFIFISLFLIFVQVGVAQSYQPLVDTNKIWSHVVCMYNENFELVNCSTDYTKFTEDTLIDGYLYKKVMRSYDSIMMTWTNNGYIREDIINKKIFYKPSIEINEKLLYDFNVNIGDSICVYPQPENCEPFIVDSIDTIFIAGKLRKRIIPEFHLNYTAVWIEGFGSLLGVLQSGYYNYFGALHSLLCYIDNDTIKFVNPDFNTCYYHPLIINDFEKSKNFSIFSNPVTNESVIKFYKPDYKYLVIYDIYGKKIKEFLIDKSMDHIKIRNADFASGIYLIKLITDYNNMETGKFIVN